MADPTSYFRFWLLEIGLSSVADPMHTGLV